jgi:hypothetical protein
VPLCECHYARCDDLFINMLNVIMLSVVMLNVLMLNVFMLSVVMLSVIVLSVVAPVACTNTLAFNGILTLRIRNVL